MRKHFIRILLVSLTIGCSFGAISASASATEQSSDEIKVKENEALTERDLNKLALSEMQAGLLTAV